MKQIYHNPWLLRYRKPFGAVKDGNSAEVAISVTLPHVSQVLFMIHKENGNLGLESYPMQKISEDRYHFKYQFEQGKGLYFYYFKIIEKRPDGVEFTRYYGANPIGGEGEVYSGEHEVHQYQITCYEEEVPSPDWYRNSVFYQIFPDRFCNGNEHGEISSPKKNSFIYATPDDDPMYIRDPQGNVVRWDFFGGNLKGIIKKIPYLKELGVNALYLNPIFEAFTNHRYDTNDYMKIDPMLGNEEIFKELLAELHKNNMHLILDGVFSHVGINSRYFNKNGDYGVNTGAYHSMESPYYSWFKFEHYPDQYKSWWGITDLPEVDKYNRSFQEYIYGDVDSVLSKWNNIGIDGWRIDVADELPDFFLDGLRNNLNSYPNKVLIGEVWEDASNKIAYDQRREYVLGNNLHSVMNYPLRSSILDLLLENTSPKEIAHRLMKLAENYPIDFFYNLFNNIGTHDTERILSMLDGRKDKLELAFGLLFMVPGVPCIYYGDEAGLTGFKDPENRRFFPWEGIDPQIYESCQKWIKRRKDYTLLRDGGFIPFYTDNFFGITRHLDKDVAIYVMNISSESQVFKVEEITELRPIVLHDESRLKKLLDGKEIEPWGSLFVMDHFPKLELPDM